MSWIEHGVNVAFEVVGFAAKNIRQDQLSHTIKKLPEPAVMEVESAETITTRKVSMGLMFGSG